MHGYNHEDNMDFFCEWNRMAEVKLDATKIARIRLYHLYEYIRSSYMYLTCLF